MSNQSSLVKSGYIAAMIISLLLLTGQPARALFGGKVDSFSADYVTISPQGKLMSTSKIYVTPEAFRMDGMPGMSQGQSRANLSVLNLEKNQKSYILNHDKKLFFDASNDDEGMDFGPRDFSEAETVKVLGHEKISGYDCVKKEIKTTTKVYGRTHEDQIIIWECDKFVMPLKTQGDSGHTMELRNIDKGKPAAGLFELPGDYRQVENMMAVMGLNFGQPYPANANPSASPPPPAAGNQQEIENAIRKLGEKMKDFKFNQ